MQIILNQMQHSFEYDLWANQKILQKLKEADNISQRLLEIFAHILGAQKLWYQRTTGGDYGAHMVWPALTIEECEKTLQQNSKLWMDYLKASSSENLSKLVSYTNSKGQSFENSIQDIMTQVIMHGTYHRAQIAILLRQAGVQPPAMDYIAYVRQE